MPLADWLQPMRQRRGDVAVPKPHPPDEESHGLSRHGRAPPAGMPHSTHDILSRCRPWLAYIVFAIFLLAPLLEALHTPELVWKLFLVAVLGFIAHKVVTFQRWGDEYPQVPQFVGCFLIMVAELLWENVMVWIVSATDKRKYDDPPGLQDNGEILFGSLAAAHPLLGWFLWWRWSNVMHFLGAVLCLAFSVGWDQHPFSGFGVMARFCATIAASRAIRVACFMSTVLPSPRPGCYRRRFPPPPDTALGLLRVGLQQLRGFGGCNDLVFSGHGAFWSLGPLVFQEYYPDWRTTALLWVALVQTSIRDVLEKQHYSVDMVLAPVVTAAVWTWLGWVYPRARQLPKRPEGGSADALNPLVLAVVVLGVGTAAIIVFVAKA